MATATDETYLHRVVAVLGAFRGEENAVSPAELARRVGLPKSTVHRIVASLVDEGLLERHAAQVRLAGGQRRHRDARRVRREQSAGCLLDRC